MPPSRPVLSAVLFLSLIGCDKEPPKSGRIDSSATGSRRTVSAVNLRNIDSLAIASPNDSFCSPRDSVVVCSGGSRDSAVFESWDFPATSRSEGDLTKFTFLGRFAPAPGLRLIGVELGHDAPNHLLWDPRAGRFAMLSLNYDSVWISATGRTLVVVRAPGDPAAKRVVVHLLTDLDRVPAGWTCAIGSDSVRIDSTIQVRGERWTSMSPDSLAEMPELFCRPDTALWGRNLPTFMDRPHRP